MNDLCLGGAGRKFKAMWVKSFETPREGGLADRELIFLFKVKSL